MDHATLQARFRGALLGTAIGDALGAPFEGREHVSRDTVQHPGAMTWTDDTHMTIGLAESLITCEGFDGTHLAHHFARRYRAEPWRGYGPGPPQIFAALERGVPWNEVGQLLFNGAGSYGNGAAMRVAPVGLVASGDLQAAANLARATARITHAHQWGIEGAVVQACAVALLCQLAPGKPPEPTAIIEALRPLVQARSFHYALDDLLHLPIDADREQVVERLGRDVAALRSVPTALYAFLRTPHDFAETVLFAVSLGGDTDTIAAMAGALAGAYLGDQGIPSVWRAEVEGSRDLAELGERLFQLTHESRGHRLA